MSDTTYQGYANYETWNVALYINNERPLYEAAKLCKNYQEFLFYVEQGQRTPDGVRYQSLKLDIAELDEVIEEIV